MEFNSAEELASLLLEKTLGNPMFLLRYIEALCNKNLLRFDHNVGLWIADLGKISVTVSFHILFCYHIFCLIN